MTAARRPRPAFTICVRFLAAGLFLVAPPAGAQERRPVVPFEGSQAFRHLLNLFQCEPLAETSDLSRDPAGTLLIVFGDTHLLGTEEFRRATGGLVAFRNKGGAVLIASDRPDNGRLRELGVRIDGAVVSQRPEKAYRNLPDCPRIINDLIGHPIFADLEFGLATNRPCYLKLLDGSDLLLLLSIPEAKAGDRLAGSLPLVAGSSSLGEERVLVLGGHGVFMNGMMAQSDNSNFRFAFNCVNWLTEGGKRRKVLLVEEGRPQTSFQVPLAELPPLPLPPIQVLNEVLHGLEQENAFNRLLLEAVDPRDVLRAAVVVLTVVLLLGGARRIMRTWHGVERRLPVLAHRVGLALEAPAIHAQRREALLQAGNLWETARDLARECFEVHGVRAEDPDRPPPFQVAGGWSERRRLGRLVGRLWALAYGPPTPVPLRTVHQIQSEVGQLGKALDAGAIRFEA